MTRVLTCLSGPRLTDIGGMGTSLNRARAWHLAIHWLRLAAPHS